MSGVNYTLYTMYVIWIVRFELYVIYNVRYMNCQVWTIRYIQCTLYELSGFNYTLYTMYVIWIVRFELYAIYNVRYILPQSNLIANKRNTRTVGFRVFKTTQDNPSSGYILISHDEHLTMHYICPLISTLMWLVLFTAI